MNQPLLVFCRSCKVDHNPVYEAPLWDLPSNHACEKWDFKAFKFFEIPGTRECYAIISSKFFSGQSRASKIWYCIIFKRRKSWHFWNFLLFILQNIAILRTKLCKTDNFGLKALTKGCKTLKWSPKKAARRLQGGCKEVVRRLQKGFRKCEKAPKSAKSVQELKEGYTVSKQKWRTH